MTELRVTLDDGRVLTVGLAFGTGSVAHTSGRPFVALVPAFDQGDLDLAPRIVVFLVAEGCIEICCVGPRGEEVHDAVDIVIEGSGQLHVVTTWHSDVDEGCEYFLDVAGGKAKHLLALVGDHAELAAAIKRIVPSAEVKPRSAPPS